MESEYEKIGHRIRSLRHLREISQGDLARKMGLSQTNLSNIEHGKTKPTLKNLFRMKEFLGCSMRDFFEDPFTEESSEAGKAGKIMKKISLKKQKKNKGEVCIR